MLKNKGSISDDWALLGTNNIRSFNWTNNNPLNLEESGSSSSPHVNGNGTSSGGGMIKANKIHSKHHRNKSEYQDKSSYMDLIRGKSAADSKHSSFKNTNAFTAAGT